MKLPYFFTGIIVKGNQLGRTIGFPTANFLPETGVEFPLKKGVYAVNARVRNNTYDGMANVGVRPTIGQNQLIIEVHIFDFSEDIYGESMTVTFYKFIRDERKFSGLESLKEQIEKDELMIKEFLSARM